MDTNRLDTVAGMLAAAGSRRAALGVLLGSTLGVLGLAEIEASRKHRHHQQQRHRADAKTKTTKRRKDTAAQGPCGNGKGPANACTRHRQCCTGYCDKRKGRCRCKKLGPVLHRGPQLLRVFRPTHDLSERHLPDRAEPAALTPTAATATRSATPASEHRLPTGTSESDLCRPLRHRAQHLWQSHRLWAGLSRLPDLRTTTGQCVPIPAGNRTVCAGSGATRSICCNGVCCDGCCGAMGSCGACLVFVTAAPLLTGDLDGLNGADAICQRKP